MEFLTNVLMIIWENFILWIALLFLIAGFLRLYFRRRKATILAFCSVLVLSIVATFFIDIYRYTTFQEAFSSELNENTIVDQIVISIMDHSQQSPKRRATTTIKDQKIITFIMDDFVNQELKKELGASSRTQDLDYLIELTVTNPKNEGHLRTNSLYLNVNENFINKYEVIDEPNHLRTIKFLENSKDIEWDM